MRRRLVIIGSIFLALVVVLAGAAWFFRKDLVEQVLADELQAAGFPNPRFEVTEVGFNQAEIANFIAGENDEVSAEKLTAHYHFADLIGGKLSKLQVETATLRLDLTGNGPPLGSLQRLAEGGGGQGQLPPIMISNLRIASQTLWGEFNTLLSGDIKSAATGGLDAKFAMEMSGALGNLAGTLDLGVNDEGALSGGAVLESGSVSLPGGSVDGLTGEIDFDLAGAFPIVRAELTLTGIKTDDQLFSAADVILAWEGPDLVVEGRLRSSDQLTAANLQISATDMLTRPAVRTKVLLDIQAKAALWPLLGLPVPNGGAVKLALEGEGTLPPLTDFSGEAGGLLAWAAAGDSKGRLVVDFAQLAYESATGPIDGSLYVDIGLFKNLIVAGLPQDANLTIASLSPQWLEEEIGLPSDTAQALADGLSISLPAEAAADPRFYLQPSGDGHLLDLAGTLRVEAKSGARLAMAGVLTTELTPSLEATSLSLQGLAIQAQELPLDGHLIGSLRFGADLEGTPSQLDGKGEIVLTLARSRIGSYPIEQAVIHQKLGLSLTPGSLLTDFPETGELSIDTVWNGDTPLFRNLKVAAIESGNISLSWTDGLFLLTHDTVIRLGEQTIYLAAGEKPPEVKGDLGRLRLAGSMDGSFAYEGTAGLSGADLRLPFAEGIRAKDLSLAWVFPPSGAESVPGKVSIGELIATTKAGRLSGMSLDAEVTEGEGFVSITATGRGPGRNGKLTLRLRHETENNAGNMQVVWGPVTFKPQGLQPADLLADLQPYANVSGGATVTLNFAWSDKGSRSDGFIELNDVAFTAPDADVSGLTTKLVLSRLSPLTTPPGQVVTIAKLNPGLAMENVELVFELKGGKEPGVVVESGHFSLASGDFSLTDSLYDFKTQRLKAKVSVDNLDLKRLSAELEMEDFAMEGTMTGVLPIVLENGDTIIIEKGKLTATGPGVIRYGKPGASLERAGGDSNLALAFEALEDFQFTTLDMTISKAADGESSVKALLEGSNPAVLDGYPFRININLKTNLTSILDALREGYKLSPDLFDGGWDFN